jgi:deazaflavin-dependent oxidoreductase (nitroreductase family)
MGVREHMWPVLNQLMKGHTVAYRATGGLIGHHFPGAPPTLLLDHVGAKSAIKRTTPLSYIQDGGDLVIVASKGGNPRHPAWFHNGSRRRPVRARVATPEERSRLWPRVVEAYGGYAGYQERTDREIPLVILEPRGDGRH